MGVWLHGLKVAACAVGSVGGQQGLRREFLRKLYIIYINRHEIE